MSKYEKIKHLAAHEFRRLTGVKIQIFNEMVAIIKEKELRKKKIGRPYNLCIEDRVYPMDSITLFEIALCIS